MHTLPPTDPQGSARPRLGHEDDLACSLPSTVVVIALVSAILVGMARRQVWHTLYRKLQKARQGSAPTAKRRFDEMDTLQHAAARPEYCSV